VVTIFIHLHHIWLQLKTHEYVWSPFKWSSNSLPVSRINWKCYYVSCTSTKILVPVIHVSILENSTYITSQVSCCVKYISSKEQVLQVWAAWTIQVQSQNHYQLCISVPPPPQGIDSPLSYHTFKISKHSTLRFTTQNLSLYLSCLATISETIFSHLNNDMPISEFISFMKQKLPRVYTQHMRIDQIKPIWGLLCMKEERPLEVVPMSGDAGIPLHTHYLIGPPVCCRNHCTTKHEHTYKWLPSE
jgi:hypothetical protein